MKLKVIYKDADLLVIDKPTGIVVFSEEKIGEKTSYGERIRLVINTGRPVFITGRTIIDYLLEKYPELKNT